MVLLTYLYPNDPYTGKIDIRQLAETTLKKHRLADFQL